MHKKLPTVLIFKGFLRYSGGAFSGIMEKKIENHSIKLKYEIFEQCNNQFFQRSKNYLERYRTLWKKGKCWHIIILCPILFLKSFPGSLELEIFRFVGKGKIAYGEQFPLFPQCFLTIRKALCHLYQF